jgi:hypothetical protein
LNSCAALALEADLPQGDSVTRWPHRGWNDKEEGEAIAVVAAAVTSE